MTGFNRSFSLPGSPRLKPVSEKCYHVRSVSLPCRSHPLLSQLDDEIRSVKAWQSTSQTESASATTSWICDGLARLQLLHTSFADLLQVPKNQASLRRGSRSEWTDRILDDFLRFADAHGSFRTEIVALSEHQSLAQIAIRRHDSVTLGSSIQSMKKTEKQLFKLVSSLRDISKAPPTTMRFTNAIEEAELAGIIREVVDVTVSASTTVFLGIAAATSATSATAAAFASPATAKSSWTPLRRLSPAKALGEVEDCRRDAIQNLEEFEECIAAVESRSARLFRCLVNARVLLLNTSTH